MKQRSLLSHGMGLLIALLLVPSSACHAADPPPRRTPDAARLEQLRQRHPEADANGDGVLTADEARAYRRTARVPRGAESPYVVAPTHADASYGPAPRNRLDFWQAAGDGPRPLLVYFHGGGFVGGDKSSIHPDVLRGALDAGISVAAVNYRYSNDSALFGPMHDAARAVQYLRSRAGAWQIDPRAVGAYGGSAGATISLWLAFHDDLARPDSDDVVARQSTRFCAVAGIGAQTTMDPREFRDLVGGQAWRHPALLPFYHLESFEQIDDPCMTPRFLEASPIHHLTPDDPPVFLIYSEPDEPLPPDSRPGQGVHHPRFAHLLRERMEPLGMECIYRHRAENPGVDVFAEMVAFFRRHFQAAMNPAAGAAPAGKALPVSRDAPHAACESAVPN